MRVPVSSLGRLRARMPSLGRLALASFAICVVSGALLLLVYRRGAPFESLALMLMKHPAATWVRGVHYWSAQSLLVCVTLYLIEQLIRRRDEVCRFGAWLRLVLVGPVVILAILSGLILRGDPAGRRIAVTLAGLLQAVPPGGNLLTLVFFGQGGGLQVVFWHHVLTFGLGSGLLLIAGIRRVLPGWRPLVGMALLILGLSLLWVPGLRAYAVPAAATPWFLAGLQEMPAWLPAPALAAGLSLCVLVALAALPVLAVRVRPYVKWPLAAGFSVYVVVTLLAVMRSRRPAVVGATLGSIPVESDFLSWRAYLPAPEALAQAPVPTVADRPEGCLSCHRDMTGFSPEHNPAVIGCTACHRGNPFTLDAALAHTGMTLTPGNLSVVNLTCATANCHADFAARVRKTLMNTMSGVVAVDKVVFGESRNLNQHYVVARLDHSPADRHLRNLCASCHLGQDKVEPAPISQQGRGGGCSACHLEYGPDARAELDRRGRLATSAVAPQHHPGIPLVIRADACFGCHSRSGRIATNFEGWQETQLKPATVRQSAGWERHYRVLDDGRVFVRETPDVHFEKGMTCTDCHLPAEIMGDGKPHAHEGDEVKIACTDCHTDRAPPTVTFARLDPETQKIAALRQLNRPGRRFVRAVAGGADYPNVFLDGDGGITLETAGGALLHPKPPARACGRDIPGHQMLACRTCHSAWAPQCISCHTSFNPSAEGWDNLTGHPVRGAWQETGGDFRADPPALGVETVRDAAGHVTERIAPFVPGMILTIGEGGIGPHGGGPSKLEFREGQAPLVFAPNAVPLERHVAFRRLYAPASPHTIVTQARDCVSCHANPLTLGYGRGELRYQSKDGRGVWQFTPALPRSPYDGLPADAWIGFLEEPRSPATTRTNARPLNRREQERMLLVGACLQCHSASEPRVAAVFAHFRSYRSQISSRCVLPDWAE